MEIEDRIYTGLKQQLHLIILLQISFMEIEDRIYTGLKQLSGFHLYLRGSSMEIEDSVVPMGLNAFCIYLTRQ